MSEKSTAIDRGAVLTYEVATDERLSDGVVAAVASVSNADPTEMTPLSERIDPDALDAMFADTYDGASRPTGSVRFSFLDHEVAVTSDGLVTVLDPDG